LATALAYEACLAGHTVLFATAIDIVNTLTAAQSAHRLKAELKKYTSLPATSSARQGKQSRAIAASRPSPKYESASDALGGIKQRAIEKWPKDYEMQEFEIRNQTKAHRSMKAKTSAPGVPSDIFREIEQGAIEKWTKDYEMQECETSAYRKLKTGG
jgi:IstB-like ATP binding protein